MTKWLTGKFQSYNSSRLSNVLVSRTGPKNPGLIILEHELSDQSVKAFVDAYPIMKSNGWNVMSAAQLSGAAPYQNSLSSNATVTPTNGIVVGDISSSSPPGSTTASSSVSPRSVYLHLSSYPRVQSQVLHRLFAQAPPRAQNL
jgi:hypothetical protein